MLKEKRICWVLNDASGYGANASLFDELLGAEGKNHYLCIPGISIHQNSFAGTIKLRYYSNWFKAGSLKSLFGFVLRLCINAFAAFRLVVWYKRNSIDEVFINSSAITFLYLPTALGWINATVIFRENMREHYNMSYPAFIRSKVYNKINIVYSSTYLRDSIGVDGNVLWDYISLEDRQGRVQNQSIDVIIVGSVSPDKKIFELLNAIRNIEGLVVKVIGSGPPDYLLKCKNLVRNSNVEFLGWKDNVRPYYLNARILISNSRFEGLGRNIIEALWYGTWVLSHNSGEPKNLSKAFVNLKCYNDEDQIKFLIEYCLMHRPAKILDYSFRRFKEKKLLKFIHGN